MCGGNSCAAQTLFQLYGLSPRVRGKLSGFFKHFFSGGSITACAGETTCYESISYVPEVYHRVCGGNGSPFRFARQRQGLSPRVRGKRYDRGSVQNNTRSITACAGETNFVHIRYFHRKVYHRVCGGNSLCCFTLFS